MDRTLFSISTIVYDNSDSNLWSDLKHFTDENKARSYFNKEKEKCIKEAMGVEEFDDPDEYYEIERDETKNRAVYRRDMDGLVSEVKLYKEIIKF